MGSRVFVNAWLGAGNLGDELLFERLLERLRAHTVDEVTAVSLDPADTMRRHPGVSTVTPRSLSRTVRAIRRADLVIVGPGGIIQDDTSPWSLPYQLHRPLLARLLHTPTIGYGLGVGPLRRRSSGVILRAALGAAAPIVVRDEPSAALLGERGIDATATADLVVASGSPLTEPLDRMVVSLRPHRRYRTRGKIEHSPAGRYAVGGWKDHDQVGVGRQFPRRRETRRPRPSLPRSTPPLAPTG